MNTKNFDITWYKKSERNPVERTTRVIVTKVRGSIDKDAKSALNIFTSQFGGLNKNAIVSIAEIDENGNQVGEIIKPIEGESAIVPTGR